MSNVCQCICLSLGMSVAWDNTQKQSTTRNQDRANQNVMNLWANAYAVKHRVPSCDDEANTISASDVPISNYMPQEEDEVEIPVEKPYRERTGGGKSHRGGKAAGAPGSRPPKGSKGIPEQ